MAAKETAAKRPARKTAKPVMAPASTLVRKRNIIVPVLIAVFVVIAAVAVYFLARPSHQGNIVATVNGEPIYQEDIDEQYRQLPDQYRAQYTKEYILNQTIDRTLLLQEAKKRGFTADDKEIDAQLKTITDQFGITEGELYDLLKAQNISVARYRGLVGDEILLNKVVQEAVLSRVTVSESDIVSYYDSHPEEFTAPAGGAVISHILVENESTAEAIIAQLASGGSFDKLAAQYSIDSSNSQEGGYLGIVTNDTPFVEEFKTAALKLSEGQYTRTPVQTQFGYHVILRGSDKEPFKLVRDRIQSQLKTDKQIAAFQSFLEGLRGQAKIRYYTTEGVKSTPERVTGLGVFAQCVAEKATLYGTSWSEFFNQQKELFGDSFAQLTYVDCDAEPKACADANVQKYPTWVFSETGEHAGKLSLQELADKTHCDLPKSTS